MPGRATTRGRSRRKEPEDKLHRRRLHREAVPSYEIGRRRRPRDRHTRPPQAAEPLDDAAQRAADYVLEDQVGYLLRCAHQRATETFNAVMAEFSVTPTQFAALAKLDDLQAVSQNQLGRLTAMDPATISGVIGRLTTRGYVQASPDPKDARVVVLGLTPAGKAAITAMKAVGRRRLAQDAGAAHRRRRPQRSSRALAKIG